MTSAGHNHVQASELRLLVERFERIAGEKQQCSDMQAEVVAEAKASGYDTKTFRQIIKLRKMDPTERENSLALLDTYKDALGM